MRVLLFTGKGGVGKSTLASATATLAARAGSRTLLLSTDAAHSLADAFGVTVASGMSEVAPNLSLLQVDALHRFERSWAEIQGYLLSVLEKVGVDPLAAEELTVLPGAEEVLALLELREQGRSGQWDVVVVDCAPTGETLRLLALPEALGWYMDRIFPAQTRVMTALRPMFTRAAGGVPMPGGSVFDAIERLHRELDEVRSLLTAPGSSVRIVLTPESVVLAEARRSYTMLSLYGYRVDGVVANRIFPSAGADEWRSGWVAAQDAVLGEVAESFAGLPVWRSAYRAAEPVGADALARLGSEVYDGTDPLGVPAGPGPFSVDRDSTGTVLSLALPHVDRREVDLARRGEELVVTVGQHRRVLTLPATLSRLAVRSARVDAEGVLRVRFSEPADETGPGAAEPRDEGENA